MRPPSLRRSAALLGALALLVTIIPTAGAASTTTVRAYFLLEDRSGSTGTGTGPDLVPVLRVVPSTTAVATAAIQQLLLGPSSVERSATPRIKTTIPAGARVRSVRISNGLAIVDLTGRFDDGSGRSAMVARLAMLTYTATQFSSVKRVALHLDGRPVTVFSSEGIPITGPMTRAQFRDDWLPPIFVDRPAYRAAMPDPARITGLSNVFEATFRIAILDGRRRVLVDRQAMATCGTGCWGTFDVTLRYAVSRAQWGWLRAYSRSAMDGSVENLREYPVWLTP